MLYLRIALVIAVFALVTYLFKEASGSLSFCDSMIVAKDTFFAPYADSTPRYIYE